MGADAVAPYPHAAPAVQETPSPQGAAPATAGASATKPDEKCVTCAEIVEPVTVPAIGSYPPDALDQ
jgi:hypothetical protein